jgi:WD40 repeat protein
MLFLQSTNHFLSITCHHQIWNIDNEVTIGTFEGHQDKILSLAFSPNGNLVVSISQDNTICIMDIGTKETKVLSIIAHFPVGVHITYLHV